MARLLVKTPGIRGEVIELKLGVNRFGRSPQSDFMINHSTLSFHHCEIALRDGGVFLRDCDSTNGTFLDGEQIKEAQLQAGQTLHMGEVEIFVENVDVKVAIPKIEVQVAAPPVVRSDGSMNCRRHPGVRATHQCTHCLEVLCDDCVTKLRRRGGKTLKLCRLCSHHCVPIGGEKKKKRSFFGLLNKTVKMPFLRGAKKEE
jgi:pSer/pThr/pTyr-binding forkhead associated (FHA) protein